MRSLFADQIIVLVAAHLPQINRFIVSLLVFFLRVGTRAVSKYKNVTHLKHQTYTYDIFIIRLPT